jgi:hypothetical protein
MTFKGTPFSRHLAVLLILLIVLIISVYFLPGNTQLISAYDSYIFYPFQSFRGVLFGMLPFSVGDVLYIVAGAALLFTIIRWIYFIVHFRTLKLKLATSVLRTVNYAIFAYLFFTIGWGANYYKPPLWQSWHLFTETTGSGMKSHSGDSVELIAFNKFLVEKLNVYAPQFHYLPFDEINKRAKKYYGAYTESDVKKHGLQIKPAIFGYFMERMAVEGYYNPFTGEGQVNTALPCFIMPFVVCHEMAHQAGIAAEGDANLLAYALGTAASDSIFNYSSYLNLWIYANNRLYRADSEVAKGFAAQLNKLTLRQLDTLDQLSRLYHNKAARYSTELFDDYLKMQDQKEGVRSYSNVVSSAWLLERKRNISERKPLSIP